MNDEIIKILLRIEAKIDNHDKMYETIYLMLKEILVNLTEESGGDLVAALRKLTEAVNSLGSQVSANPAIIVSKLKTELDSNNGSNS